jgi:hypothetical protein
MTKAKIIIQKNDTKSYGSKRNTPKKNFPQKGDKALNSI